MGGSGRCIGTIQKISSGNWACRHILKQSNRASLCRCESMAIGLTGDWTRLRLSGTITWFCCEWVRKIRHGLSYSTCERVGGLSISSSSTIRTSLRSYTPTPYRTSLGEDSATLFWVKWLVIQRTGLDSSTSHKGVTCLSILSHCIFRTSLRSHRPAPYWTSLYSMQAYAISCRRFSTS